MTNRNETATAPPAPRRVTQGEIILRLLERGSSQSSSVTISRNAKGDVQFEVVVRTDPDHGIADVDEAKAIAERITDELVAKYPNGGAA